MSAADHPTPEHLWGLWRKLRSYFPMWSMAVSSIASPGAMSMLGNDFISGLNRNPNTGQVRALLAGETPGTLDALSDLAELNARRQEQVFNAAFILYITLPLALGAAWSDVAPAALQAWIAQDLDFALTMLAIISIAIAIYWLGLWRAKQIVSVLALIRIERGMGLHTAGQP